MLCEMCGKNEATAFLTLVVNDKMKKMHLCAPCAAESGLDGSKEISIADVLLGLGGKKPIAPAAAATDNKNCPRCQMRLSDFKKTSRLGCEMCYEAFAPELAPLLQSMQSGAQHVGKRPSRSPSAVDAQRDALKDMLAAAVKAEKYEEAAHLRDRLLACSQNAAGKKKPDENC